MSVHVLLNLLKELGKREKYVHKVLVNLLVKFAQEKVRSGELTVST